MDFIADGNARRPARRGGRIAAALTTAIAFFAFASLSTHAQAQLADLVVNQADSPDPGPAGGIFTYTVRVDNNGPNAATAVNFVNVLPAGSTFVGVTTTQGSCGQSAGTVTCALGNLAFLANATVTMQVRLPSAGVWTNTSTATAATPDPNTSNNINVTEDTTAQIATDMRLSVTESLDPVAAGQPFNYLLVANNNGPTALAAGQTQTIAFSVPAGACITAAPSGSGWSCTASAGYPLCSGSISCTRTTALAVGANAPTLTVPAVANIGGSITGAFQVSSVLPDSNPADNTVTATTTVTGGSSDVQITKTAAPTTVAVGSNVTYTLTPRHNGGEPPGTLAPNEIVVTDVIPAGLTLTTAPTGTGWTCDPAGGFPIAGPVTVTCRRPGPYTGGNFTNMPAITIAARVDTAAAISNTASIAAPETDPVPANNSSTVGITGSNDADLSITKTASIAPVVPNQAFNYLLTVRNNGPVHLPATRTITVTDTIPVGLNVTARPTGTGWTCLPASGYPLAGPVSITCSRSATLNSGANAPVITVPVIAPAVGSYVNNACVASSGTGPADPNAGNNCAGATVAATLEQADLRISKTAAPNPVRSGENLTYTMTVTNDGPDPATNVTLTDALGSLVTTGGFQSVVTTQGTCTPSTTTNGPTVNLSCNLGTLSVGASATVTVVVRPLVATTAARTNTATVNSADVGDPDRTDNTGSVTSQVTALADVIVSKTATPNPVRAGTPLTYVLTARNNGPSTASAVQAVDTLPANAAFVSMGAVTGSGSCTAPTPGTTGGTITCNWASITTGAQQTATFIVRPLTSAAGGNVVNQATITTSTEESNSGNNSTSITTPVTAAQVDILVNKVDSVDPVALGQSTVYTVTVTNAGPSFATNVQLVDTFPSGSPTATFSYQGGLTISPPGVGTCSEPPIDATSGVITCSFPGLANASSAVVTYTKRAESIASGVSGTTFNHAVVSAAEPETQPNNNQTTHATTSRRTADLQIVKTAPPSFTPGVAFAWTLTVTNHGPNDSVGAIVTDTLPAGVTFQGASPGCTFATGTVTCTLGALATGASTALTINVLPASPWAGANPLENTAAVATVNEVDPVDPNNVSTVPTTPGGPLVDLSLVKNGPATVLSGGSITWQITIANAGPSAADGATWVDTLPAGVTGVTAFCTADGGAICGPVDVTGGSVNGSMNAFPAGSTALITLQGIAPSTGPLENTATVSPPPGGVDPNPGNNSGSSTTTIPLPDLTIAKTAGGTFSQGQVGATYALTVSNAGAAPSFGVVTVTDTLPASLTATGIAGSGWSCTLATLTCTRSDALAQGASYPPITLTVNVAADAPASIVNTAQVSGGGETNTGNNTGSVTTTVTAIPDLTIVKVANGTFQLGQVGATYTLTVSNVGGGATSGTVTVLDPLPTGLTPTSATGTGWTCNVAVPTVSCTRSDPLAAGASYPAITITVNVASTAPASVTNTGTVSGGGETNTSNNASTVTTPLAPVPDLTVVKVANGAFTAGQVGATYTLTASNVGNASTSAPVSVTDTLPTGLTATAIAGDGWSCVLATLTCTRADALAASASYPPITLTVDVGGSATGNVVNIANVSGGGETNTSNNTSSVTTPLAPVPDLAIEKVANGNFTLGQVGATYTLTVRNVGSAATTGTVTVTDTLPAGLTATAMAGTGWSCNVATLSCTRSDALAAGASWPPITLTVDVSASAPSSVTNTASVTGGGETNTSNNSGSAITALVPTPDLTMAKRANGTFTLGQVGATYTLTVSNVGSGPTSGVVTVTDVLPVGLTATALAGDGWTCVVATVSCTRGDALAAGASWPPITLTVNVASNATSPIVNVASVAGGGEIDASNNSGSASTPLQPGGPSVPAQIPVMGIEGLALMALLVAMLGWVESRRRVRRIG